MSANHCGTHGPLNQSAGSCYGCPGLLSVAWLLPTHFNFVAFRRIGTLVASAAMHINDVAIWQQFVMRSFALFLHN